MAWKKLTTEDDLQAHLDAADPHPVYALDTEITASAASKLFGRGSAGGSGKFQEISLGSGLAMAGTTLSATGGASGDLALSKMAPASDIVVTAGYTAHIAEEYECVSGVETEVGVGSVLEIT